MPQGGESSGCEPRPVSPVRTSRVATVMAVVSWGALLLGGMAVLDAYALEAGPRGMPQWTRDPSGASADGRWRLVMVLHPKCPCSRASVAELARLVPRLLPGTEAVVLAYCPGAEHERWADTPLLRAAAAIPGVHVRIDRDGREAELVGGRTSGHVALFHPDGRLMFSGGITPARGHEGDSLGQRAILACMEGRGASPVEAPVFGCAISHCRDVRGTRP